MHIVLRDISSDTPDQAEGSVLSSQFLLPAPAALAPSPGWGTAHSGGKLEAYAAYSTQEYIYLLLPTAHSSQFITATSCGSGAAPAHTKPHPGPSDPDFRGSINPHDKAPPFHSMCNTGEGGAEGKLGNMEEGLLEGSWGKVILGAGEALGPWAHKGPTWPIEGCTHLWCPLCGCSFELNREGLGGEGAQVCVLQGQARGRVNP